MGEFIEQRENIKPKLMGIGKLGDPSVIFVRQFRWTLESDSLEPDWNKSIDIDYQNKLIKFEAYEVFVDGTVPILAWCDHMMEKHRNVECLFLSTFDGCGELLYQCNFFNVKIVSQNSSFNYESSKESVQQITVSYESMKRKYPKNGELKSLATSTWNMHIEDINSNVLCKPTVIKLDKRPELQIEETEINYLNAKTWVPGKAHWHPCTVTIDNDDKELFEILLLTSNKEHTVVLTLSLDEKPAESWRLKKFFVQAHKDLGTRFETELRFNEVGYNIHK